jgi:hypothetical protein
VVWNGLSASGSTFVKASCFRTVTGTP